MLHVQFFRQKLAHHLRNCAARRRQTCGASPSGEDLKTIDLFGRLARDAEQVPQGIIDHVAQRCLDPAFARSFETIWDSVNDIVGTILVPRNTTELIRWMVEQACYDPGPDGGGSRAAPPERVSARDPRPATATRPANLLISVVSDFTGSLAVVGPALAFWEGSTAIRQWRDHAYAQSHPQQHATVVDAAISGGPRSASLFGTETIRFMPADGQATCTIAVPRGVGQPAFIGQSLAVVPRSRFCESPLIPAAIGDPMTSATIAVAFLASGIASFKMWLWLRSRPKLRAPMERSSRIEMRTAL